jgi:hypothetical protein
MRSYPLDEHALVPVLITIPMSSNKVAMTEQLNI